MSGGVGEDIDAVMADAKAAGQKAMVALAKTIITGAVGAGIATFINKISAGKVDKCESQAIFKAAFYMAMGMGKYESFAGKAGGSISVAICTLLADCACGMASCPFHGTCFGEDGPPPAAPPGSPLSALPYYDVKTAGDNGSMDCATYCETGHNNEAPKGSTCVAAMTPTADPSKPTAVLCDATSNKALTCYCRDPPECDVKTAGDNGSMDCATYCETGHNNEAPKGSTCIAAEQSSTGLRVSCEYSGPPTAGDLACCCRDPPKCDVKTVGDNGSMDCATYCKTGHNNEAPKGSTCIAAERSLTGLRVSCEYSGPLTAGDLACCCKDPLPV